MRTTALLRRLAGSDQAGAFVLRGGLLTRHWVGPDRRRTRDLDFLGLFPRDLDEATARLSAFLCRDMGDGSAVAVDSLRGEVIWQERALPGMRFFVEVGSEPVQIDVGFGDPLEPAPVWIDYPDAGRVLAARPELLAAWKLDGLFDHGAKRWQAKDLFDLWLLTSFCTLDGPTFRRAVEVAFATHGSALSLIAEVVYDPAWWQTDKARERWAKFRAAASVEVPEDVAAVAARVAAAIRPLLAGLC